VCELVQSGTYGQTWTRLAPGKAFIPHGPAGSPDSHTTYAAGRPLIDPKDPKGDRLLMYYAGGNVSELLTLAWAFALEGSCSCPLPTCSTKLVMVCALVIS
jgi:hypothetical protein